MKVSGGALPVWSCVGPWWMEGFQLGWMIHWAALLSSMVQPQKDESSKLQANQTYAEGWTV